MSDLTLTGAIPGLLRRGSPVTKTWLMDNDFDSYDSVTVSGVVLEQLEDDEAGERWSCWFFDERIGRDTGFAPDLDLTDPTGRYHALLWLRERGHELRWAEDEAEVLAWSVLSVVRGGGPIIGILAVWTEGAPNSAANYVRENVPESGHAGLLVWHKNALWMLDKPCGQSPEDRAASDRAALAAGYALRSDDGTLTLPPLPEVFDAR